MTGYVPIDCGFHDRLLALATLRRSCELLYLDADGREHAAHGRIVDVYSRDGAEHLRLESGTVVRLDRILRVDGQQPPAAPSPS